MPCNAYGGLEVFFFFFKVGLDFENVYENYTTKQKNT